ncbi:MAG: DUF2207 domain-containing protein [Alkalibacterium sp.]|nr:DUF2207 domain-containing protein [Alkalibacterium sp.]MCC5889989.1 DUF2207 domain-containing protein [Alkalibacterium sp.]
MKKGWGILWLISLFFGSVVFAAPAEARGNTLHELNVEVRLLENGTGIITEYRDMTMEEGTELFISIEEVEGLEVVDFSVTDMTEQEDWDSDQSREEKADTYGMIDTPSGKELVWGIGDYGRQLYEVSYTISNVVRQLDDGQSMHWNFNTFGSIPPESMTIEITGPFHFAGDTTRIYGFGYDGQIELSDGRVESATQSPLSPNQPVSVIVHFLDNPFLVSYYENRSLDSVVEEAREVPADGNGEGINGTIVTLIVSSVGAGVFLIAWLLIKVEQLKKDKGKIPNSNEQRKRNKGMAFTGIPYDDGSITDIAFLLRLLQKGSFEHYFFAFLMKWAKEKSLIIEEEKSSKKQQAKLTFLPDAFSQHRNNALNSSQVEEELWKTLVDASDENNQMSSKEMKKWAEKQAESLADLDRKLMEESKNTLINEGFIKEETASFFTLRLPFIAITKKGQKLYDQLTQFENHLSDLTKDKSLTYRQLIPEESFLIWAGLYGKEEEVFGLIETLLPEWEEESSEVLPVFYTHYYGLHVFSSSMNKGYSSGNSASSSGFGGATSIGGGGGTIGGSGGGAR